MESEVKVSIIIPCFNRVDRTVECWKALRESFVDPTPREVIFIDNGSTDGTSAFLADLEKASHARALRNRENLGFARANNQGAAHARGEFLVFLNNDTIPLPGWLEPMIRLLSDEPDIGVVGSKLLYPDGRVQHAGIIVRERAGGKTQLVCDHIHRLSHGDAPWVNLEREYQAVTGACLAVKRDVFRRLGGFDEAYFNGYEDLDFCFRAREAGLRIVYCPRSVLVHHESSSQGRFMSDDKNTALFSERWGSRIKSDENEAYAAAARPNLDEIKSELKALRASFEKIQSLHPGAADDTAGDWKRFFRKPILRWLGISRTQRKMAADIRAMRNTILHLRRVTESMAMLLDYHDVKEANASPVQHGEDKLLQ